MSHVDFNVLEMAMLHLTTFSAPLSHDNEPNVAQSNLRSPHVAMLIVRKCNVPRHYLIHIWLRLMKWAP